MLHYRSCNLCEAMCGVVIEADGDRVTSVRGDSDDPFSRGYICPKATALGDIHHDPDRLRAPLRRTASGDFEEIDWETALSFAASRLDQTRRRHGKKGVALYLGNPTIHNLGASLGSQVFSAALGSHNRYSATSVDQLPKMLAAYLMYGHQLMMSVPDVDRTDCFVLFGANPLVSNGSLMSAPGMKRRLEAIRARGGRVIVFDPRRTETARAADEHVFVRPGTDAVVLLSMIQVVFEERLARLGRLAPHLDGLDALSAVAEGFSPEETASVTGVPADVVRRVTREIASAERCAVYGRVGVSIQEFGALSNWLIEALNALTGHLDEPGGMMFTTPAVDLVKLGTLIGLEGSFGRIKSRVRGAPGFSGELPVSCLAEEIETPGEGQVRALVTLAGNIALSTPNGRRLERALSSLDFMVSIDPYLNETSRHAHVILPPAFALERPHYDVALHAYAVRNTARWSSPLFAKAPSQRDDWEILTDLSARLTARGDALDPLRETLARGALSIATPRRIIDALLRVGPHGVTREGITVAKLEASPHGVDLGPLERVMPAKIFTRDRKIKLAPSEFVADVARLEARMPALAHRDGSLVLIGRRELRSNNSWGHNVERMVKGPARCTLRVHPDDASARDLRTGDRAKITSRVGEVVAPVEVTDEVMPGVACLPHGWGHDREKTRMRVASAAPGVSANDVTDETVIDELAGTSVLTGVPVRVTREESAHDAAR